MLCENKCNGCTACYNACPNNAIEMIENEDGFYYPSIKKEKCINCKICEKICPVTNSKEEEKDIVAYACYNKDLNERLKSSSGGIFSLLAKEIIKKNGIVFGAAFNNNFDVEHICIDKEQELEKIRGSKYVQSKLGDVYKKVKKYLESDRYVLFTGTPCQIEGLLSFLQKDYEKLYTQDLICHGVPAPKVWKKYKEYRESVDGLEPKEINFRNKDNGWKEFNIAFKYKNNSYIKSLKEDEYMQAFLKNVCLRDSCYECSFKKIYRKSDITLGDFWGINKVYSKIDDNNGCSAVIINSQKGLEIFESIKNNLVCYNVEVEEVFKHNSAMIKSVKLNKNRNKFMKKINNCKIGDFKKLVNKYKDDTPIYKKLIKKLKRILIKN